MAIPYGRHLADPFVPEHPASAVPPATKVWYSVHIGTARTLISTRSPRGSGIGTSTSPACRGPWITAFFIVSAQGIRRG